MTENLARERYVQAWQDRRRLDDEAWLASVRKQYPVVEEFRRKREDDLFLGDPAQPKVEVQVKWQFLYQDEEALD